MNEKKAKSSLKKAAGLDFVNDRDVKKKHCEPFATPTCGKKN